VNVYPFIEAEKRGRRNIKRACEREGEERTFCEVVVDGTDASEGWYAWSPLARRSHSPLPPAETADRNRRPGRVDALLPHWEQRADRSSPKTIMPMVAPWLLGCPGTPR
jgi:hypothetical protein